MRAMSNPGQIIPAESSQSSLLYLVCHALMDQEVGLAVIGRSVESRMIREIRLTTGCFCTSVQKAHFIIVTGGSSDGALAEAPQGCLKYPDQGATVIYPVQRLGRGSLSMVMRGPGIRETVKAEMEGILTQEIELAAELNSEFPLGVELIFIDDRSIMAVPRSAEFLSIKGV